MGLLDKAVNKTKSFTDQTSSRIKESEDVGKVKSQIHDEEKKIKENTTKIGEEYIAFTEDNDNSHMDTMKTLAAEVVESKKKIEELEKQCEEIRAQAHEDRENIRAEEAAKNAESDAKKE